MSTYEEIKTRVNQISSETKTSANTATRVGGAINAVLDFANEDRQKVEGMVVDIKNYEQAGKILPTSSAIFLYDGKPLHYRLALTHQGSADIICLCFCVIHDENSPNGSKYIYYNWRNDKWNYGNTYTGAAEPEWLKFIFNENTATTSKPGLMSTADKTKLNNIGELSDLQTKNKIIVGAINEVIAQKPTSKIVLFKDIVSNVTLSQMITVKTISAENVFYDKARGYFVGLYNGEYFSTWGNSSDYNVVKTGGVIAPANNNFVKL